MSVSPTAHFEFHEEFHFAEGTNSCGFCGCWKSSSTKKKTVYYITSKNIFKEKNHVKLTDRVKTNQRLAALLSAKFENDEISNDEAFERLKDKVELRDLTLSLTEERLAEIMQALYAIKYEITIPATHFKSTEHEEVE